MSPRHGSSLSPAPVHAFRPDRYRAQYSQRLSFVVLRIVFATIICTLLYSVVASAQTPRAAQSLDSIHSAIETYVRDTARVSGGIDGDLFIVVGDLDPRLQLNACGSELKVFTLNNAPLGARNTIAVRCHDENGPDWTIYVPASIEIEKSVFVLRRSVPRDAHITAEDVELQRRRIAGLGAGYFGDIPALREQHLKRSVSAGAVLTADAMTRDLLVKRGQEVFLVFGADTIAVRAAGIALTEGGAADRIRVQNRSSLKVVEGTVESGNLVRVGM